MRGKTSRKVFISHTSELRDFPSKPGPSLYEQAENAVTRLGYAVFAQDYFPASALPAAEECESRIADCDYVVFIIGFKWGSPVKNWEGEPISYTEFEFDVAQQRQKPCFVFLLGEKVALPYDARDADTEKLQQRFRARLKNSNHVVEQIDGLQQLSTLVYQAIREWEDRQALDEDRPPVEDIAMILDQGDLIPFLGEGAALPPDYEPPPTHPRLDRHALSERFKEHAPSSDELGMFLADYSGYPTGNPIDLPGVASYYAARSGRPTLISDRLREAHLLANGPRPIHRCLAGLERPLLIVCLGFDDLMETALAEAGRPFRSVIHPMDEPQATRLVVMSGMDGEPAWVRPQDLQIDLTEETVIFKPRGSFVRHPKGWDQFVATEDSNIDVLAFAATTIPAELSDPLLTGQFLFLGVGLESWTIRSLVSRFKGTRRRSAAGKRLNEEHAWAVRRNPSELERRLWKALDTEVFDIDLDHFASKLESAYEVDKD